MGTSFCGIKFFILFFISFNCFVLAQNKLDEISPTTQTSVHPIPNDLMINDSVQETKEQIVASYVDKMISEEQRKQKAFQNKIYGLLIFLFVGFVVKTYFMVRYYKKTKRERRKMQRENLELLKTKFEKEQLEQQLNVAFEEVVQLAKENSPEFLIRFQEVYPDCYNKLIEQFPSLQTSELKFCAMLFLNFSSKDIAEFTFVTPKAVQNRKNRLRKKLNIASDEDLNVWIQRLCG